jgi:hypothetical protein
MPRDVFLTAGEAWLRCRAGEESADRFGHGDVKGLWFMKVNVCQSARNVDPRSASNFGSDAISLMAIGLACIQRPEKLN